MKEPILLCPFCGVPLVEHEDFSIYAIGAVICDKAPPYGLTLVGPAEAPQPEEKR